MAKLLATCNDKRECGMANFKSGTKKCTCLETTYPDGECPFCKEDRCYTNGVYYPHRDYSARGDLKKKKAV